VLLIRCPWCGDREESEFHYGGQAELHYPPPKVSDADWAHYLFFRDNPAGPFRERWAHVHGCRQWFTIVRDTTTHQIIPPPAEPDEPR
jgi:heterotetrameric sarcosine oxidase delta subunit